MNKYLYKMSEFVVRRISIESVQLLSIVFNANILSREVFNPGSLNNSFEAAIEATIAAKLNTCQL